MNSNVVGQLINSSERLVWYG